MPEIEGGTELRATALRLKAAGLVDLRKQMDSEIRKATLPARPAVRASAMATLPRRGGLNQWVAKSTTRTTVMTGARTAGVAIRVSKRGHDMKDIDAGKLRHPVYGNRGVWTLQTVPAGFASRPLKALSPVVAAACYRAMRNTAAEAGFH